MQKITAQLIDPNFRDPVQFQKKYNAPVLSVSDTYLDQLQELFLIRNPKYRFDKNFDEPLQKFVEQHLGGKPAEQAGVWFYFPWRAKLVHLLDDDLFQEVRTARNRNLITVSEQQKIYSKTVAVSGLSVGSHCLLNIALSGIGNKYKIADFDVISASNLNRISSGVANLGEKKSDWATRAVLEINPYAEIYVYEGVTPENIAEFLGGSESSPAADILVEELDSLNIKVALRVEAKKLHLPVVMVTDTENTVADIERHDLSENVEIFNGLAGDVAALQRVAPADMVRKVVEIIGPGSLSPREQSSMLAVGKEIYSWPQLGAQAGIAGGLAAYLVRKILLGANIKNGKYNFDIDGLLDAGYGTLEAAEERRRQTEEFKKQLGL